MRRRKRIAAVLLALGVLTGCGGPSDRHVPSSSADRSAVQSDHNDVDTSYAHNMVAHGEQAVEMAQMVPTNTTNQQLVDLANQVIARRVPEIQAFRAWLMQWQDAQGNDPVGRADMPAAGMVAAATLERLRTLHGDEFDRLWLTSMVDHDRGAVAMAQDEVAHGKHPDVIYLAKSIIAEQQAEMDRMTQMLGG